MKHGAKNRSNTRKILNNNNVHTHTRTHPLTLFFWLTNNVKQSINYNKTKFLKQQNTYVVICCHVIYLHKHIISLTSLA